MVRQLLAEDNLIVDIPDRYGNTALHTAAEEERAEVAQLLISHGASREILNRDEKSPLEMCSEGRSALLYAASKGRENIVSLLIKSGADVNKADKLGATPLHRS